MDRTTEILSEYAYTLRYEDLPPETVHQVKRTLADTMGCAIGGFNARPSEIARKLAFGVTSTMPSRIIGTSGSSAPDLAGFANGVMVRYLDCNDAYFSPGGGHPSDMIPGVLAVADPLGSDGRTVITAIVLAYEVFCRLSDQVVAYEHGWDQGIFSVIGATCGAGKVMGLNTEAMSQAIFTAGINWKVVHSKWEGIREAFAGFDVQAVAGFTPAIFSFAPFLCRRARSLAASRLCCFRWPGDSWLWSVPFAWPLPLSLFCVQPRSTPQDRTRTVNIRLIKIKNLGLLILHLLSLFSLPSL